MGQLKACSLYRFRIDTCSMWNSADSSLPTFRNLRFIENMSHDMTKSTKWHDSDQPGHSPSLSYPLSALRRLGSDWADAQADLSLRWAHNQFCWFCHEAAQLSLQWQRKEAAKVEVYIYVVLRI